MNSPIDIETADVSYLPDFMALVAEVGWPHKPEDISSLLLLGRPWRALNRKSRETIGVAVWWPMGHGYGRVGMVIVSPKCQGCGVGRAMMHKVIEDSGTRTLMLLTTEEGKPLYEKLGFESVGLTQRHQGHYSHSSAIESEIHPAYPEDLSEIVALDANVTGFDRSSMITQMFNTGNTNLLRAHDQITGYAIARPFGLGSVLGPLIARNEDDAEALFTATSGPGMLRIDRLFEAENLGHFLEAKNLPGHEITHSMVRGSPPIGRGNGRIFTMAGHAWG